MINWGKFLIGSVSSSCCQVESFPFPGRDYSERSQWMQSLGGWSHSGGHEGEIRGSEV